MRQDAKAILSRVDRNGPVPPVRPELGPCWIGPWKPKTNGYREVRVAEGLKYLHVLLYEYLVGPIPAGHELDHLCRNHGCGNPNHTQPVTHQINVTLNSNSMAAQLLAREFCAYGHDLTSESAWYYRPDGTGRMCNQCRVERDQGRSEKKPIARLVNLP